MRRQDDYVQWRTSQYVKTYTVLGHLNIGIVGSFPTGPCVSVRFLFVVQW